VKFCFPWREEIRAMPSALSLSNDYSPADLRRLAKKTKGSSE
jgi:hypothetical protein